MAGHVCSWHFSEVVIPMRDVCSWGQTGSSQLLWGEPTRLAQSRKIGNASRWWTRPQERIARLGSIALPRQSFLAQNQLYDCEHMVFNPWNSLPEHRPLGSVDRMRFAVYLASRQVRRKTEHGGS